MKAVCIKKHKIQLYLRPDDIYKEEFSVPVGYESELTVIEFPQPLHQEPEFRRVINVDGHKVFYNSKEIESHWHIKGKFNRLF